MTRLSRNDEIGLRAMLADCRPPGGFTASLECLAGILGEIDALRAEVAAARAQLAVARPAIERARDAFSAAAAAAPRFVPAPGEDDLL